MPQATIIRGSPVQSGYWQDRTTADFRDGDARFDIDLRHTGFSFCRWLTMRAVR